VGIPCLSWSITHRFDSLVPLLIQLFVETHDMTRKFRGHSGPIHDISVCPSEDLFLTASSDHTVRLWNISQAGCIGQMDLPTDRTTGNPHVVFDSTGMVFAVMAQQRPSHGDGHYIHLYDARNFQGGAFSEMSISNQALLDAMAAHHISTPYSSTITLNKIDFNVSGNRMLVQSDQGLAFVLDGYDGNVQRVVAPGDSSSSGTVSCFTPDDQSVLLGSDHGCIDVYDIASGACIKQMEGHPPSSRINAIACNPKYQQIASSCRSTWYDPMVNNVCMFSQRV
jgi:COMPASS component SWD2